MADHEPCPGEDLVQLLFVNIGVHQYLAADEAFVDVDQSVEIVIPCHLPSHGPLLRRKVLNQHRFHNGIPALGCSNAIQLAAGDYLVSLHAPSLSGRNALSPGITEIFS